MTARYEIQTKQSGIWQRWIGGSDQAVKNAWDNFVKTHKEAARLVLLIPGGRVAVIDKKSAGKRAA